MYACNVRSDLLLMMNTTQLYEKMKTHQQFTQAIYMPFLLGTIVMLCITLLSLFPGLNIFN